MAGLVTEWKPGGGSGTSGIPLTFGAYQRRLFALMNLIWLIDGAEMYVMSLVLPELDWGVENDATLRGLLGGGVFAGMMIGSVFFGWVSDQLGRLFTIRITTLLSAVFGALSALSQSPLMLLVLRLPPPS